MKQLKRLAVLIVVSTLILLGGITWAQNAKFMAKSGFMPEVVTIAREMADDGQVCAEPKLDGVLLSCRTVKDFRAWVKERPLK
jgi:hypothetical protein